MKIEEQVSVIITAYNERKNIQRVLDRVSICDFIDEIVVVDDGSIDKTADIVSRYSRVKLIKLKTNQGKGAAIVAGINSASHDLLLFLDADLLGLTRDHLLELLAPLVYFNNAKLALGLFGLKDINSTNLASRMFPAITGQRAIRKSSLPKLSDLEKSNYGVDLLIYRAVPRKERIKVILKGLSQVIKERKTDKPMKAVKQRIKMYRDIAKSAKNNK